jgi:hypothetical protein
LVVPTSFKTGAFIIYQGLRFKIKVLLEQVTGVGYSLEWGLQPFVQNSVKKLPEAKFLPFWKVFASMLGLNCKLKDEDRFAPPLLELRPGCIQLDR